MPTVLRTLLLLFFICCHFALEAQPFMFVFLNKKEKAEELPKEQLDQLMSGHMANIQRLAKEGKLIAAGPFDGGGGIFIFKADSKTTVEEWLSTDPGIQAKRWNIEIFPYQPRVGSVCAVGDGYTMVNYQFVRFSVNLTKYTIGEASTAVGDHERYLRKNSDPSLVVAEGSLGSSEGSILILRENAPVDWITRDPAVRSGAVETDQKKLYIAQGSFCEKP